MATDKHVQAVVEVLRPGLYGRAAEYLADSRLEIRGHDIAIVISKNGKSVERIISESSIDSNAYKSEFSPKVIAACKEL